MSSTQLNETVFRANHDEIKQDTRKPCSTRFACKEADYGHIMKSVIKSNFDNLIKYIDKIHDYPRKKKLFKLVYKLECQTKVKPRPGT